jgi:hypothetical protein
MEAHTVVASHSFKVWCIMHMQHMQRMRHATEANVAFDRFRNCIERLSELIYFLNVGNSVWVDNAFVCIWHLWEI